MSMNEACRVNRGRRPIVTDTAPAPAGAYSQAIVAGGFCHIAGQTPRRPDGTRINDVPFAEQARQAFANVEAVARAAGTSLAHAVSVTIYLTDIEDRAGCDEIWQEFMTPPWPARAIVQSGLPGFAIEISAICLVPAALPD